MSLMRNSLHGVIAAVMLAGLANAAEINLYSGRHYDSDAQLYAGFEAKTGIKVNIIEGKADELVARIEAEGDASPADVFFTADAGNLWRAEEKGLFQAVDSEALKAAIPAEYRDPNNQWFGFSRRARIIFIAKGAIDPALVQTYADLARPELKGKLCMRSGSNIYNLSLLGGMIEKIGAEKAEAWAKGVVDNLAKEPQGGDSDQIKSLAAGECAVTIANTYYFVRFLSSDKPEDKAVADKVQWIFPDQNGDGAHVNISGAGVAKYAPNRDGAVQFLEYLSSPEAQVYFAKGNNEYPVAGGETGNPALDTLGAFKADTLNVAAYGRNQKAAQEIMDRVGWK
ncbi:MAG: Fe(3+) ABC transporter substrate-binding protein [Micropepsaceae bacterium]